MSGTSSSIRTKVWWNSHWMILFQNCVRQSRSPTKMATAVQLRCYWKQFWSRWAITGSWEPLVLLGVSILPLSLQFLYLILELFWQCDNFCVSCYCRMLAMEKLSTSSMESARCLYPILADLQCVSQIDDVLYYNIL